MANPEILNVCSSKFPPEPFVEVGTDGELTPLTLTQALQQIQKLEEERRSELFQKARKIGETRPHGGINPLSRRVQNDARRSLEGEARKRQPASRYPLISCILRSPSNGPFQIPAGVSPRYENFPQGGEENPFYRFICDRPVEEALRLLNQPTETIKTLWEIFSQRLELHQKVLRGEVSPSDALTQFMRKAGGIAFPENLVPLVREIAEKFPLTTSRNHRRRF